MRKLVIRTTACCVLSTCMIAGTAMIGNAKNAATVLPTGGIANVLGEYCTTDSELPSAGITDTLDKYALSKADADIVSSVSKVSEEYRNLVIAQIDPYVTVRAEARDDAEEVGKLYNNSAATVLGESGEFYQITSGNVTGYIRKDCVVAGEAAQAVGQQIGERLATAALNSMNIYASMDTSSQILYIVSENETMQVLEELGDWVRVSYAGGEGYVLTSNVTLSTKFAQAESKEEEAARIAAEQAAAEAAAEAARAAEEAARAAEAAEAQAAAEAAEEAARQAQEAAEAAEAEAAEEAARQAQEAAEAAAAAAAEAEEESEYSSSNSSSSEDRQTSSSSDSSESSSDQSEWTSSESSSSGSASTGQQIADYALQFVGNPYVWGGTSLTNGADCSGFVLSVFSDCGISVAGRTAAAQATGGTRISASQLQPGDLVFYASGGRISHVAIYIGDGQIVHAANSRKGIIVSSVNYMTPYRYVRY
ncbi:MAG: NlpC/P60 family protein [Lachnospiraceae bacterium]